MSGVLSLPAVSEAVYDRLHHSSVTNLAPVSGAVVPQGTAFPYVWYVLSEEHAGGMGASDGPMLVNLRVHVATSYGGATQAQRILAAVKARLKDEALTFTDGGLQMAGQVFYEDTSEPFRSVIAGVECLEAASNYYLWVEPAS